MQKYFFEWSIDIFQSLIDNIKFSTETQWRLGTAVCKVCPKYTKGIIVRLHPHRVTNWHCVTVEKKENVPWTINAKLCMQFMTVTSSEPQKLYFGLAEGKWKQRYYNHKKSFNRNRYSHETTLSSYVLHLKENLDVTPNLKWSIVMCVTPYPNISKKCLLCLYEKLVIITYPRQHELLNKQSELFCKCGDENKYLLKNLELVTTGN